MAAHPVKAKQRSTSSTVARAAAALMVALAPLHAPGVGAQSAGASPEAAVVVRDDRGAEHRFAAPPQRIVSMMPSLTELLAALGARDRLVGIDRYADWPPEIAGLPRLGGLDDAHIEAIAALRPDVVLASSGSRAMDRLEALGLRVIRLKSDRHADVRRTLDLLARLTGRPEEGARVWAGIERQIDAAAARVPAAVRGARAYFEIGGGPYAAGTPSFIGETLARLGLVNVVPVELGPFPKLNPEFIVRMRPEVILGLQREMTSLPARPGWQSVPAVRRQWLCGFDATQYDLLVRPGPRLGQAAHLLADCLAGLPQVATDPRPVGTRP